jgi:hypothetical protein
MAGASARGLARPEARCGDEFVKIIKVPPPALDKLAPVWAPMSEQRLKIEIDRLEERIRELEKRLAALQLWVKVSRKCNRS